MVTLSKKDLLENSTVDDSSGCITWNYPRNRAGYGVRYHNKKSYITSRLMWIIVNGEIPNKMVICHKCDNPPCLNPAHLFIGTKKDNSIDMINKGRCHQQQKMKCINGHNLYGSNLCIQKRRSGRICRICKSCRALRAREAVIKHNKLIGRLK